MKAYQNKISYKKSCVFVKRFVINFVHYNMTFSLSYFLGKIVFLKITANSWVIVIELKVKLNDGRDTILIFFPWTVYHADEVYYELELKYTIVYMGFGEIVPSVIFCCC